MGEDLHHINIGPLPLLDLGFVQIPTYYLVISLTYCLGILWFYKRCETRNLSQKNAMDLSLIILLAGFIGARLTHVLFEQPDYYLQNPTEIFSVWQGGFVFYGGALTAYAAAFLYARKMKQTFWLWHDTMAPVLAFGYATGRVACFLSGCCYGKACDLFWATPAQWYNFKTGLTEVILRHPTQLYASLSEYLILFFLLWFERRPHKLGLIFLSWVSLHSINRMVMEFFRDDPRGPTFANHSLSTIVSLVLLSLACTLLVKKIARS